jgi:hypothetical protein
VDPYIYIFLALLKEYKSVLIIMNLLVGIKKEEASGPDVHTDSGL